VSPAPSSGAPRYRSFSRGGSFLGHAPSRALRCPLAFASASSLASFFFPRVAYLDSLSPGSSASFSDELRDPEVVCMRPFSEPAPRFRTSRRLYALRFHCRARFARFSRRRERVPLVCCRTKPWTGNSVIARERVQRSFRYRAPA